MEALPAAVGTTYARLRTTPGRRIVIVSCSHPRRGSPLSGHRRQPPTACESADDAVRSGVTGAGSVGGRRGTQLLAAIGICPLAAISGYPETASFVTECGYGFWRGRAGNRLVRSSLAAVGAGSDVVLACVSSSFTGFAEERMTRGGAVRIQR
jgi:hypothetical protein